MSIPTSTSKKTPQWKEFELRVASIYKDLGAIDIATDVNLNGNQIDVIARVPSIDGTYSRYIVSCKHYASLAGIETIKEWNLVFRALRDANKAEVAVIVSALEFTRPAREAAQSLGIRLFSVTELEWANTDLHPYLEELDAEFRRADVFKHDRYIPVRLRQETSNQVLHSSEVLKTFLTDNSHLLVVLGDFGAGKTTLSRHIFLTLAKEKLVAPHSQTRTPIYLNLRDYSGALNIRNLLLDELVNRRSARCSNYSTLRRLMTAGRLVLILDAFDEMASRTSLVATTKNFNEILELCADNNKIIVTSRTHFFKSQSEVHELTSSGTELLAMSRRCQSSIVLVEPFTEPEIEEYVRRTCPANADVVLAGIKNTYDLFGLAKRPILLQMITEVLPALIDSGQKINATSLYTQYVANWLKRDDWRVELDKNARQSFTTAFALNMYRANKSSFAWEELQAAIKSEFPSVSLRDIQRYESEIRTCTFIRRDGDRFEFVHQSFAEYFISCRLYRDIVYDDNDLLSRHAFSKEILAFLAEHMGTVQVRGIIRKWLLDKPSSVLVTNVIHLLSAWESGVSGEVPRLAVEARVVSDLTFRNLVAEAADFDKSTFKQCHFGSCNFRTAHLSAVELRACSFKKVEIAKGDFENVLIEHSEIEDCAFCDLAISQLRWRANRVHKSQFKECEFEESEFTASDGPMLFHFCNFGKSYFVKCPADFESCTVTECSFNECDFLSQRFVGARFNNCEFLNCKFNYLSIHGAVFNGVKFGGTTTVDFGEAGDKVFKRRNVPEFYGVSGLPANVIDELNRQGVIWRAELQTPGALDGGHKSPAQ